MTEWFAQPWFLLLLPLPFLLAHWHLRRRRPALRFPDVSLLAGLPSGRARRARWGGAILRGAVLLLLVLAAANPRTPDLKTRLPVDGIAIALIVDLSGSMGTDDFAPPGSPKLSRLEAAKQAFTLFVAGGKALNGITLEGRVNDQIGLITFAAVPVTVCPLTLNHTVLLRVLNSQTVKTGIDAGTNLGDAIVEALIRLEAAGDRPKVLVLLSDGENNKFGGGSRPPREAADFAAKLGIPIHAIDCGGDANPTTPEDQKQRAEGRAVMEVLAEATGGKAFSADNSDELREVLAAIDKLEKRPAPAALYRRYHEFGPWCGLMAAGVLIVLVLLEQTHWRGLP